MRVCTTSLSLLTTEMLKRDCLSTLDIFRRPAGQHRVQDLLFRIKQGLYTLSDLFPETEKHHQSNAQEEVHVLASALVTCLLEPRDPLFPESLYDECLLSTQDSFELLKLCRKLDKTRYKVVVYVVTFLQVSLNGRCATPM